MQDQPKKKTPGGILPESAIQENLYHGFRLGIALEGIEDMLIGDWLYIIERSGPNHSMFYAEVGSDFYEDFNYLGCSVRGSLADILTEIKTSETEIDIMWDDLKPEAQERIKQLLGDNGNYDMFPIATIYAPGHEQNMQMQ